MAARPAAEEDLLEVRCAGCGETLEVERGLTEFACPDCATPQALPLELMPPPLPPRRRRAVPLPSAPGRAAPPPASAARLPCGACGALLSVPPGLARCGCPVCGAELAVDPARLRRYLEATAAPPLVPVSPPPVFQAPEVQQEYPDSAVRVGHIQGYPNTRLVHVERSQIRCRNTKALSGYPDAHTDRDDMDTEVSDEINAMHCHMSGFSVDSRASNAKSRQVEALNHVVYQVQSQQTNYSVHAEGPDHAIHVGEARNKYLNHAVHKKRQAQTLNQTTQQIGHTKVSGKKPVPLKKRNVDETPANPSLEIETDSDEDIREVGKSKRSKQPSTSRSVRGRGATSGRGKEPRTQSRANPGTQRRQEGTCYNDNIDLSFLVQNIISVGLPTRAHDDDPPLVNFRLAANSMKPLRFSEHEDPRTIPLKQFKGDLRFWLPHQADWYESVILHIGRICTPMNWVDWNYMNGITGPLAPVIKDVYDRCVEMDLDKLMAFVCPYNEEIVAQFYATLWIDQNRDEMHWTTNGKRFSVTLHEFAGMFGLAEETAYAHTRNDHSKVDLHRGLEIDDLKLAFMYDGDYGEVQLGKYKGLSPYYKLLNQLFRGTMYPRAGDADNISKMAKNLLFQMAPGRPKFKVFNFIWNEIILCSYDSTSGCHYAPYIFHMIKNVSGVNILADRVHNPYHSSPGKIAQLLKLKRKAYVPVQPPPSSSHGASSSHAPRPSQAPSSSYGPPPPSDQVKKGKLDSILQGVFAFFNMCCQNAQDLRKHRQFMDEEMLKFERRDKAIMAKVGLPHSPVREPREFPSPPPFYNPWEETSQDYVFGAPQEEEKEDEEEEQEEGEGEEEEEKEEDDDEEDDDEDDE